MDTPSRWRLLSACLCLLWSAAGKGQATVVINEVMASNTTTVLDGTGDAADWIEIYNHGSGPVDLSGHYLSDDASWPAKFQLPESPEAIIAPGGFLVLWASGDPGRGDLHLGFKISAEGEPVLLGSPDGQLIDLVPPIQHYNDISYGRIGDGAGAWGYFETPTPAAPNGATGSLGRLPAPSFSVPPGFHTTPLQLGIGHNDPGVTIYYSLDGSTPGPELLVGHVYHYKNIYPNTGSPAVGPLLNDTMRAFHYTGPIQLADPSPSPNILSRRTTTAHTYHPNEYMPTTPVRKACIVRAARAFKEGYLPSEVVTGTWFLHPGGADVQELPVMSLVTEKETLFGFHNGIYIPGQDYEQWRLQNMAAPIWGETPANWNRKEEFPISMEWFETGSSTRTYHRNAGFRLHGSYSRLFRRKSMRLYFRDRYGAASLDHAMFPRQMDTGFQRLVVHISGNDDPSTNMRDRTLQELVRHMRFETQDSRPVVVFLDGEYWGVHAMRERYDEKYFERVLDLPAGSVDLVERFRRASLGDSLAWVALLDQVAVLDPAVPAVYGDLLTKIDMENHIDHHVAQVYVGNLDWPNNNWKAYRKRTDGHIPDAPLGHDGRWRWLTYDLDFGFNLNGPHYPDHPYLAKAMDPAQGEHTLLFRRLLRNTRYKHDLINRAADMLNTAFRPEVVNATIAQNRDEILHDMQEHVWRWRDSHSDHQAWLGQVDEMLAFGTVRAGFMRQELLTNFQLAAQHELKVDISHAGAGWVELNSIHLHPNTHGVDENTYPWTGIYFQGVPVLLVAHAFPGWEFSHWEGAVQGTDSVRTLDLQQASVVSAVFVQVPWCAAEVVLRWHFNDLPAGTLQTIPPDVASVPGAGISYAGMGAGYLDRTPFNEGTTINSDGLPAGHALRVRNPSSGRSLIIEAPSTGYRDLELSYALHRTQAGADSQKVYYTTDPERLIWHLLEEFEVGEEYVLKVIGLDDILGTSNQPSLAFKIEFTGPTSHGNSGNHRLDNVVMRGRPYGVVNASVCEGGTFVHQGIQYEAGVYLVENGQLLGCDRHSLLYVSVSDPDTSLTYGTNSLIARVGASSYQWIDCGTMMPVQGATENIFSPVISGTYAVLVSQNGCTHSSSCHNVEAPLITGIHVHPNPAIDHLHISMDPEYRGSVFELKDMLGRVVLMGSLKDPVNTVFVGSLPTGSYLLHVHDGERNVKLAEIKLMLR